MSDKNLPVGDGVISMKIKDAGDGTFARVMAAGTAAGQGSDKLVNLGDGTKIRLKDMGDGTFSKVIFGA